MMRLPPFQYLAPASAAEAIKMLAEEGPTASVVAGGTDLYPNMKRRHQTPKTLIALRRVRELSGIAETPDGGLRIGPAVTLTTLERDPALRARRPALWTAVKSISTPLLRNMGTIGGNVLLDTRCNYYDQNYEWRRAIHFCMKCDGTVCWTAPGSDTCLAVQSSDTVPVLCALDARVRLASVRGVREIPIDTLFRDDGIHWLTKEPDELLTDILLPPAGLGPEDGVRATYGKLRRRGSFDFPVLGAGVAVTFDGQTVRSARIFLGGVASAPVRCREAEAFLAGKRLDDDVIRAAADLAYKPAKPLDNTDFEASYRKKMARVYVRRGLEGVRGPI